MILQVKKAIPIFEKAFPGDIGVFAFDNSSGHVCKASDVLVASRMNLNAGGKQPYMRDTVFNGRVQCMVYKLDDTDFDTGLQIPENHLGRPKGLKRVLQERGLWRPNLKKQCGRAKKPGSGPQALETEEDLLARTLD